MTTVNSSLAGLPLKSKGRQTAFYSEFCNQSPKPGSLVWVFRSKARLIAGPPCSLPPKSDFAREEDTVFYLKKDKIEGKKYLFHWVIEEEHFDCHPQFYHHLWNRKEESQLTRPTFAQTFLPISASPPQLLVPTLCEASQFIPKTCKSRDPANFSGCFVTQHCIFNNNYASAEVFYSDKIRTIPPGSSATYSFCYRLQQKELENLLK